MGRDVENNTSIVAFMGIFLLIIQLVIVTHTVLMQGFHYRKLACHSNFIMFLPLNTKQVYIKDEEQKNDYK